jgi:hypothetical protein
MGNQISAIDSNALVASPNNENRPSINKLIAFSASIFVLPAAVKECFNRFKHFALNSMQTISQGKSSAEIKERFSDDDFCLQCVRT